MCIRDRNQTAFKSIARRRSSGARTYCNITVYRAELTVTVCPSSSKNKDLWSQNLPQHNRQFHMDCEGDAYAATEDLYRTSNINFVCSLCLINENALHRSLVGPFCQLTSSETLYKSTANLLCHSCLTLALLIFYVYESSNLCVEFLQECCRLNVGLLCAFSLSIEGSLTLPDWLCQCLDRFLWCALDLVVCFSLQKQ